MLPLLIQDEKLEIEMKQTLDTMQLKIQLRNIANIAIEDQSMIIRSIIIELHQTYLQVDQEFQIYGQ